MRCSSPRVSTKRWSSSNAPPLDPGFKRAAFGLARSLQESGRLTAAIAAWERYLNLDDSSSWSRTARDNLAKLRDAAQP